MGCFSGPEILNDGLVLALDAANAKSYPGIGTAWTDLSGRGNTGTLTGGPTYSSANGGSIVFDGTDDHVSFTSNPSLTNQISVEVWVNLNSPLVQGTGMILGRESSYRLVYTTGTFSWICATTNNGWYTTGTTVDVSVLATSGVFHVVCTYDGSNNRVYVNGSLMGTGSAISGNISTDGTYYLFRTTAGNVAYGRGSLYSHKLYNRALTASEIRQNFNATRGRFGI